MEDFGESQEDISHRLMEVSSEQQRTETIAVPNSDSAEQDEPQPILNNPLELTTMPVNTTEEMDREEPRLTACPQTEGGAHTRTLEE